MSSAKVVVRRVLRDAAAKEIDHITEVLLASFLTHPFTDFMIGGRDKDGKINPKQMNVLRLYFRSVVAAALIGGQVYVGELPGEVGPIGASVWFGPDESFMSSEEQMNAGWGEFMQAFESLDSDVYTWFTTKFLPAHQKITEDFLEPPTTQLNSWHLLLFGVAPQHQGKGVGTALMKDCEQKAGLDTTAKPESLVMSLDTMTEEGLKFYTACGFETKVHSTIDGPNKVGGYVDVWCMKKDIKKEA